MVVVVVMAMIESASTCKSFKGMQFKRLVVVIGSGVVIVHIVYIYIY